MSKNEKNDFFKDLKTDETVEQFKQKSERKLSIIDNDVFKTVFFNGAENKLKLGEIIIQVVFENETIRLKALIVEDPKYDIVFDEENGVFISRGVYLDMLAVTEDEAFFIIEFQKQNNRDDLKRFIYEIFLQIQEQVKKSFKRGSKFEEIKRVSAIIFTKYDLLEEDLPRYWFDELHSSREGVTIEAPFDIIFVNTENKNPETALGRLVSDLSTDNPEEMYYDEFRERMKEMQEKPEEYIQASENYYDGIRIDLSEGIKQKFNEFRAEVEKQKAEAEKNKAEAEKQKAETEKQKAETEKHIAGEVEQKARADTLEKQMKGILESFIQNGENLETLANKTGYSIDKLKELLN